MFSLKSLPISSPCLILTFCQLTTILKENYCSLHKAFIMRRSIWLQYKICLFPSTSWIPSWGCCHLRGAAKQVAPAFLLLYFTIPLEWEYTSHWLTSCFSILHSREINAFQLFKLTSPPTNQGRTEFSSSIKLWSLWQIVKEVQVYSRNLS